MAEKDDPLNYLINHLLQSCLLKIPGYTGSGNHPTVDGVAPLVADPSLFNSTTMQNLPNPVKSCKRKIERAFRPNGKL